MRDFAAAAAVAVENAAIAARDVAAAATLASKNTIAATNIANAAVTQVRDPSVKGCVLPAKQEKREGKNWIQNQHCDHIENLATIFPNHQFCRR